MCKQLINTMSRLSLFRILKTIPVVVVATFCLYQVHVLLQPRRVFVKKAEPRKQMSELEARTVDQLRLQIRKNEQLRQLNQHQQQLLEQKAKELEKLTAEQKKQAQIPTNQLQQKQLPLETISLQKQQLLQLQKATTQQPLRQVKEAPQPVRLRQVQVQGHMLLLQWNVSVVPSLPPNTSTLTPRICLPFPHFTRPVTVCIHDPRIDTVISGTLRAGKLWEENFVLHLDHVLKANPEMGFVDIGANIGLYTLVAAANGRNVLSVEFLDANILLLQHSLQLSNLSTQVTLVKNAVYRDHNSKLRFETYKNNMARAFITQDLQQPDTVQSVCLDDLIPLVKSRSVFMRMDMNNTEHHVLACGHEFFNRNNVRVVQIKWSQKSRDVTDKISSFMDQYNYTAHTLVGTSYHSLQVKMWNWTGEVFYFKTGL